MCPPQAGSRAGKLYPGWNPVVEKKGFLYLELPGAVGPLESEDIIELCGVCTDICVVFNALYLRAHYPDIPLWCRKSSAPKPRKKTTGRLLR